MRVKRWNDETMYRETVTLLIPVKATESSLAGGLSRQLNTVV